MFGIVGVYSKHEATEKALYNLYGVQHRGQESAGISAAGDHSLRTWRDQGLVSNVFDEKFKSFIHPEDYVTIGSASGEKSNSNDTPPIEFENERYKISIAKDGFVLSNEEEKGQTVEKTFWKNIEKYIDIEIAFSKSMKELENAYYSLVMAIFDKRNHRSELIAARDRKGIRPLYLARGKGVLFVASESAPIDVLENMKETVDGRIIEKKDVTPGSMIRVYDDNFFEKKIQTAQRAHCIFEWVYYGRPDSVIEKRNVHSARKRLGHSLVRTHQLKKRRNHVIIPVPDSGRSVSIGVAEALGSTADEGVIKNAYLGRTYLIDDPKFRKIASDLKHNIIKEIVENKKVTITDDSIVRGTVSESVAQALLVAGAIEVDFLVSYAPIFYSCFSDPPDKPLAAASYKGRNIFEIGDSIASQLPSISSIKFNSIENVIKAIDIPESNLCTMCVTGRNPYDHFNTIA